MSIAGDVFAACTCATANTLATRAGGVIYSTRGPSWRDEYEYRFEDGSVLHVMLACVGYGAPGRSAAVRVRGLDRECPL